MHGVRRNVMLHSTLFASVDFDGFLAELTLDAAAPVELAAAALGDSSARRRVAATAAHEVAAVGARRMPVAQPATSARRPGLGVWIAETA